MIVIDASAVVEMLIHGPSDEALRSALTHADEPLLAPHLLDIEVASALRSLATGRRIDAFHAAELVSQLERLPVTRCAHSPLLARIWELRHNFTAYDAAYIALAEATDATLYTCDDKLTRGHRARVKLFP